MHKDCFCFSGAVTIFLIGLVGANAHAIVSKCSVNLSRMVPYEVVQTVKRPNAAESDSIGVSNL